MLIKRESELVERMMTYSLDLICTVDSMGRFIQVSHACSNILGYNREEMEGRPFLDFVCADDRKKSLKMALDIMAGKAAVRFTNRYTHKNGSLVYISWSCNWSEDDESMFCIGRDVSEIQEAKQKLHEKDLLYDALMEYGQDMLGVLDENLQYKYLKVGALKLLGYSEKDLLGKSAAAFIHPDDMPMIFELLPQITSMAGHLTLPPFRFRNSTGEWRWLETTISNQLANPAVAGLVVSSRDITDRVLKDIALQESQQRFKALFDNNPDMVLIQNREGFILDVNKTGTIHLQLTREGIINKHISDFMPASAATVCEEYLAKAFAGDTVKFELELEDSPGGTLVKEITKIPVYVNDEVSVVYSIIRDITEKTQYHNTLRLHSQKLNTIFESITDAFFTLDNDWNFSYVNHEFERMLKINREACVGKNIWEVFPEERDRDFYQQYAFASSTGKTVHFEAFFEKLGLWLEVKAFPSVEGLSVYFNDISERVIARKELEKLSLVASNTTNGVIITGADNRIVWVNAGFTRLTGFLPEEVLGHLPSEILFDENSIESFLKPREQALQGESVAFEVLGHKKNKEEVWISVQINPLKGTSDQLDGFIATLTDITQLKKSELELAKLAKDLYRQNRDLQQFTYIVSHNLRAPVANAMGLVNLLGYFEQNTTGYKSTITNLQLSVNQLDTVLRDMNTILSIRDSKDTIEEENILFGDVLQQAVQSLSAPLQRSKAALLLDIPDGYTIKANRAYMHSILYNLLSNAVKYRKETECLQIKIKVFGSPERGTVISFSDNGTGFDIEKAGNNVFKLYKRFHKSTKGRGIGLFLIKTHLEAMEGNIEVSSKPGVGTRFLIFLKNKISI